MNSARLVSVILLILAGAQFAAAQQAGSFEFRNTPVRQAIQQIESETGYRFLYRDALIANRTVSFSSDRNHLFATFAEALRPHRIALKTDDARRQVFLFALKDSPESARSILHGYVVDAADGTRLPFATITWSEAGTVRGVATNAAGAFAIPVAADEPGSRNFRVSYVGYRPVTYSIDPAGAQGGVTFRLQSDLLRGQEVVIVSAPPVFEADTTWRDMIRMGVFSPFGEQSVLRSLQPLPAVGLSSALSDGLNVRGSRADGFQVLLDGMSIYNQQHFFGLFDAFNDDALQKVGFHYDVTPAYLQGPPGGTLSFLTRTGSQTTYRRTVGASNTAYNATFEGPIPGVSGSWLLSGRQSYLTRLDWFNNGSLLEWGLDTGRETSPLPPAYRDLESRLVIPGPSEAAFYDFHGKLFYETAAGARIMVNTYLGGDNTRLAARRFFLAPPQERSGQRLVQRPVETASRWGNEAASVQYQHAVSPAAFWQVTAGFSRYYSAFSKDDFTYTRFSRPAQSFLSFIDRFDHESSLLEIKLAQSLATALGGGGVLTTGLDLHHFDAGYYEESVLRPDFELNGRSVQADAFAHYSSPASPVIAAELGARAQYFSRGSFLGLSPRAQVRFLPRGALSFGAGYSRNHQFLHRIFLSHIHSPDVWVMSSDEQPPASVDNFTGGVYLRPHNTAWMQVEGYFKRMANVRQHEMNVRLPSMPRSLLLAPWYADSRGTARGVEAMYRQRLGPLLLTQSYALGRVEMQNDLISDGEAFVPDWDRTHQYTAHGQFDLGKDLTVTLSWMFATGSANPFRFQGGTEPDRLDDYHRLDAAVQFRRSAGPVGITARASCFNLYNQKNPWYRSPVAVYRDERFIQRIEFVNLDVYDLGFQPSFDLTLTF